MDKLSWKLESLTKTSLVDTLWGQWDQQACSPSLRLRIHLASPLAAKAGGAGSQLIPDSTNPQNTCSELLPRPRGKG